MLTPYDWQEGIGNRAQYVEARLGSGAPVLSLSLEEGILLYTFRRQSAKLYEVYDRIAFAAIGQQSDVEAIRIAAVEFAHREGFQRSEDDVTIARLVAAVSSPLKQAFGGFNNAPFVARSLFVELGSAVIDDKFYIVDYDGDYRQSEGGAILVGAGEPDLADLFALDRTRPAADLIPDLRELWQKIMDPEGERAEEVFADLRPEAMLLERNSPRESIFRTLL
ncbi:MAG: hypothetical protein C4320_02140 [Armatimonadota bacterium]